MEISNITTLTEYVPPEAAIAAASFSLLAIALYLGDKADQAAPPFIDPARIDLITSKHLALGHLERLISLVDEGAAEEGIFRVSGSAVRIQVLFGQIFPKQRKGVHKVLSKAKLPAEDISILFSPDDNIHTKTGLLKKIVREKYPALLGNVQTRLCAASLEIGPIKDILADLEEPQKIQLQAILALLARVAETEGNEMGPGNLATCMAPNLFQPEEGAAALESVDKQNNIVAFLIENYREIYC